MEQAHGDRHPRQAGCGQTRGRGRSAFRAAGGVKGTFHGRAGACLRRLRLGTQTRQTPAGGEGPRAALLPGLCGGEPLGGQVGGVRGGGRCLRVPALLIRPAPSKPTPLPPARPPHRPRELPTCRRSWHQSPVQAVAPTCLRKAPLQRPLRGQAGRNGHPHPPAGGLDPSRPVCRPSPAGRLPTPPPPDQEPSARPAGSPAGSGPSPGSAAAVTAAPLLRSRRWGGSSEPCRAPPTTQPPPRTGARSQGRKQKH